MTRPPPFVLRWLLPLLGGALTLGILALLYRNLDLGRFLVELRKAEPGWIAMLAGAVLLEQLIQGWKWRQLLYDLKPISSLRLTGAFLAGYGANVLVPLGISPLVRSWLVARLEGLRVATVLMTTAISRFVDAIVFGALAGLVAAAGTLPQAQGSLRTGLAVAGAANLALFSVLLWLLFRFGARLHTGGSLPARFLDHLAGLSQRLFADLPATLADGIRWPRERRHQLGVVAASIAMKAAAATHFLWAGLAVGIGLSVFQSLFVMLFAGFALILGRFVRVPGGFVIGSGLALKLLGVPDEPALAMILLAQTTSLLLVVGIGMFVLWRSGIDLRAMPLTRSELR